MLNRTAAVWALAILAAGSPSFASSRAAGEIAIVVTTSSDASNGDTSSWPALQTTPGPDGISLREAIQATNNDPGSYAISFAPELAGRTIDVGREVGQLPALTGGNVSIDGDVTGDGGPDITLRRAGVAGPPGLTISSGGNTIHAIALQRFGFGVFMQFDAFKRPVPGSGGHTYTGNTVSGLVITGENGIDLAPNRGDRWLDTRIVGNTMTVTQENGISVQIMGTAGDRVEGLTIERNTVRVAAPVPRGACLAAAMGITAIAGGATGDAHGVISNVLIDHNSVSGDPTVGIMVGPGGSGTFASNVQHVRILDNRVDLTESPARCMSGGGVRQELMVVAGDDNLTRTHETGNVVQDVEIRGNRLATGEGIRIFAGSGGARNTIRNLRIVGNTIYVVGHFPGVNVHGCEGGKLVKTTGSRISDVTIDANRISIVKDDPTLKGKRDGGIYVAAADNENVGPAAGARVEDVRITGNHVDTRMIGINLIGGNAASSDILANVLVARNIVSRAPAPLFRLTPQTRGISVAGGTGEGATGNRVMCVRVTGNTVAGVRDAVSVVDNASGAHGNHAMLGGC